MSQSTILLQLGLPLQEVLPNGLISLVTGKTLPSVRNNINVVCWESLLYLYVKTSVMESAQQSQIITITPKAAEKVSEFMKQEGKDNLFLRVYVSGGGCSGLSYGMGFEEKSDEDDYVLEQNGVKVLIDSYSQNYLKGANVDYIESLMGSGFKIDNPNVTKSCSCGHSFSTDG
jgi:iron-sulfur cluster assembly accessory protein